jgi:hypothetical protein
MNPRDQHGPTLMAGRVFRCDLCKASWRRVSRSRTRCAEESQIQALDRTTAPASSISLFDRFLAISAASARPSLSAMIGTSDIPASSVRACRRDAVALRACGLDGEPDNCCGWSCHRRAISDTRAPGTNISATICAFFSADQRRRRPRPVGSSTPAKCRLPQHRAPTHMHRAAEKRFQHTAYAAVRYRNIQSPRFIQKR